FEGSYDREPRIMHLDPEDPDFTDTLAGILGDDASRDTLDAYRGDIREARAACLPLDLRTLTADDFFPMKQWRVLSLASYMLPDPYTGLPGVEQVGDRTYRVTTRLATRNRMVDVALTLRATQPVQEMRMAFSPLLDRFYAGQDHTTRPVRISDSGRIRNELQTLAAEAIEYRPDDRMKVHLDRIDDEVMPPDKKDLIRDVLSWYRKHHPVWFGWLETD
ncbi:MAG: hypothetical protein P8Z36_16970, partial [Gemmatimonadota bacterium]